MRDDTGQPRWDDVTADALEAKLRSIWQEVLGRSDVDIDVFFFDLGGTSLHALQAIDRIEQELGTLLPITILFEAPTIRLLASSLRAQSTESEPLK